MLRHSQHAHRVRVLLDRPRFVEAPGHVPPPPHPPTSHSLQTSSLVARVSSSVIRNFFPELFCLQVPANALLLDGVDLGLLVRHRVGDRPPHVLDPGLSGHHGHYPRGPWCPGP